MPLKTHRSAVVVVPPQEAWGPIQEIRRKHDRQFHRWMPHVNLLYPFLAEEESDDACRILEEACAEASPFEVALREFDAFVHGRASATLWLRPEPERPLLDLQSRLLSRFPGCDDVARFPRGFTPHLSVGQARGRKDAEQILAELRASWKPLSFRVDSVALIQRGADGPFRVARALSLRGG